MNNFAKNLLLLSTLLTVCGTTESWGEVPGGKPPENPAFDEPDAVASEILQTEASIKVMARKGAEFSIKATNNQILFTGAVDVAEPEKSTTVEISSNLLDGQIIMESVNGGMVSDKNNRIGYTVTFWDTELVPAAGDKKTKEPIKVAFGTVKLSKKIIFKINETDFSAATEGLYSDILTLTLSGK